MKSEDEVLNQIKSNKRGAWLGIIFFGVCAGVGLLSGQILLFLLGAAFVVAGAWVINKGNKLSEGEIEIFVPKKSHRRWVINDPDQCRAKITKWQIGLSIVGIIFTVMTKRVSIIGCLIAGLLGLQVMKTRIKIHTMIDDASLFELEERGIITPADLVKSLYKDFNSWAELKPNAKLLLLTQDRLISIIFNNADEVVRNECSLSRITKLGFSTFQTSESATGSGTLLFIGTVDNDIFRIKLLGSSYQDSPEIFISQLIKILDELGASQASQPNNEVVVVGKTTSQTNADVSIVHDEGTEIKNSGPSRYIDL